MMLTKQERAEIAERLKDCPEGDTYGRRIWLCGMW